MNIVNGIGMRIEKSLFIFILATILFANCFTGLNFKKISEREHRGKVCASWLGQCVGNIYGLPHENVYIDSDGPENFPYGYGRSAKLLRKYSDSFSDDDTDIEYIFLLKMKKCGIEPTLLELDYRWMYHVRDRVWLANRAVLAAMYYVFLPPITGWKSLNSQWLQIDSQLINEILTVTSPGMVFYSSTKALWVGSIIDDDWGTAPTIFYGAIYFTAFIEKDIHKSDEAII